MARRPEAMQYTVNGEVVWPVGRVAEMLGIPAVTIRSWERRYGIGPSLRSGGQHRRYSAKDVARLRQMIALIAGGMSPADAARLIAPSRTAASEPGALPAAAESYQVAAMAEMLDGAIERRGIPRVWNEVVAPAFHELELRFVDAGDCIDLTVLLAGTVHEAVSDTSCAEACSTTAALPARALP
jgi:DNA-binding transcriptional MerR regulator